MLSDVNSLNPLSHFLLVLSALPSVTTTGPICREATLEKWQPKGRIAACASPRLITHSIPQTKVTTFSQHKAKNTDVNQSASQWNVSLVSAANERKS